MGEEGAAGATRCVGERQRARALMIFLAGGSEQAEKGGFPSAPESSSSEMGGVGLHCAEPLESAARSSLQVRSCRERPEQRLSASTKEAKRVRNSRPPPPEGNLPSYDNTKKV